jgi:hypothetical protein
MPISSTRPIDPIRLKSKWNRSNVAKAPPLEYLLMVDARIYRLFATIGIMLTDISVSSGAS